MEHDVGTATWKGVHFIPGFHAVREALCGGHVRIDEIWIAEGKRGNRLNDILRIAQEKTIPVRYKKNTDFQKILPGVNHQGIALLSEKFSYSDLNHIVDISLKGPGHALLVAADHITDEGNLGALIRTVSFFGGHGLLLPKDRSAQVTERLRKRSSGAYVHMPVARVVNLGRVLDSLDKKGFWIIGAAEESHQSIYGFDWKRDLVLILGSEDKGLSRSVRSRCHQLVCIPSHGNIHSLNVSVAGGIILSEIVRRRIEVEGE